MEKLKEKYQLFLLAKKLQVINQNTSFYDFMCNEYETAVNASKAMGLATTAELRRYCQSLDK